MNDGAVKSAATTAASTCLLLVGDRVVLRATAPPEAEYAMFELGEIELRASEPGRVREHGYQTTADLARSRLANLGLTAQLARDVALTMQPVLSDAYARGAAVRRVARYLGPAELFQSETYDGRSHAYRGVFLDLAALERDLELPGAGVTLHALYLASLLESESDETTILLSTDACTKGGKPGARTYRRPVFADNQRLLSAIGVLAQQAPQPEIEDALPRADVIAFLRTRGDTAHDSDARALYKSLESSVSMRDMPDRGPLAASDLWAIECRLENGEVDGISEALDQAERVHGRTPGTTYLRARIALAMRLEPAKLIAERVSALALSMTSFQELGLLAAEAWLDAGDPRRAMPYARDLVDATGVDEGLLLRAQRLLARAVGAAPQKKHETLVDSIPVSPQPSRPPGGPSSDPGALAASEMADALANLEPPGARSLDLMDLEGISLSPPSAPPPAYGGSTPSQSPSQRVPPVPSQRPASRPVPPPSSKRSRLPAPSPVPRRPDPSPGSLAGPFGGGSDPPPPLLEPPPLPTSSSSPSSSSGVALDPPPLDVAASFTLDLPGPDPITLPDTRSPSSAARKRMSGVLMETRPPNSFDPRAEPDSPMPPRIPTPRIEMPSSPPAPLRSAPPGLTAGPKSARRNAVSAAPPEPAGKGSLTPVPGQSNPPSTIPPPATRNYMHGASLAPYQLESPAPLLTRAPLLPKLSGPVDELAEHLPLPPGVAGETRSLDVLPTSILEARVQFTLLSRELGLDYRLKRGIDIRADVSGIEAMQAFLLESFPDHTVRTTDEAYELRRHGALLSEILARRLDAEWLDISPNEIGYWAMIIPPDTRVWPFGRVARLVAMGHKERDLVSYFLELQTRARGRG